MRKTSEISAGYGWRILAAIPVFLMGGYFIVTSRSGAPDMQFGILCALPFILAGAIIIAPLVLEFLAEPFRALFLPGERYDRPQPMYSIPASKRKKGQYAEAIAGYREIATKYPGETRPYTEMIEIALLDMHDREMAMSILSEGMAVLTREKDRLNLCRFHDATLTRLDPKPEWLKENEKRVLKPQDLSGQGYADEPDGLMKRRFHPGGEIPHEEPGPDSPRGERRKIPYPKKDQGA